ncbi:MAG: HAD hydrolase-like protein [Treponema sp.]|nr:HAD hydrolase-like protein [Treponema sp.]
MYEHGTCLKTYPKLRETLKRLGAAHTLAVVTSNPVLAAGKTLEVLALWGSLSGIVGLDTCLVSKPHAAPFLKAATLCGVSPSVCVPVGGSL